MPLKGVDKVRGRYQALIKEISGPRTVKVVNAIVATGAAYAKLYTPVDTSALINSQRKQVSEMGSGVVVGRVLLAWRPVIAGFQPDRILLRIPHPPNNNTRSAF